jgi:hypothetical protein
MGALEGLSSGASSGKNTLPKVYYSSPPTASSTPVFQRLLSNTCSVFSVKWQLSGMEHTLMPLFEKSSAKALRFKPFATGHLQKAAEAFFGGWLTVNA